MITPYIEIEISSDTASRLDRARYYLDCPKDGEYSTVIEATLDEAGVSTDMTQDDTKTEDRQC